MKITNVQQVKGTTNHYYLSSIRFPRSIDQSRTMPFCPEWVFSGWSQLSWRRPHQLHDKRPSQGPTSGSAQRRASVSALRHPIFCVKSQLLLLAFDDLHSVLNWNPHSQMTAYYQNIDIIHSRLKARKSNSMAWSRQSKNVQLAISHGMTDRLAWYISCKEC